MNQMQRINEMSIEELRELSMPVCWECGLYRKAPGFTRCERCLYGEAVRATGDEIYARKRFLKMEAK